MKLDRNINPDGAGKYALIKLRNLHFKGFKIIDGPDGEKFLAVPEKEIDFGDSADTDFFVIRLKDKYAAPALAAYAFAAMSDDPEYGREVLELAQLSWSYPYKTKPT